MQAALPLAPRALNITLGSQKPIHEIDREEIPNRSKFGEKMMKSATKLRLFGGIVLIFNLWLIGQYNLQGIPVLLLTFGFAVGYEFLVVRPVLKSGDKSD